MVRSRPYSLFSRPQSLTDALVGPLVVSAVLFVAVLANFIIRGVYHSCSLFPL